MRTIFGSMAITTDLNIRVQSLEGFCEVSVDILRLDEIHPAISGNKWFKLKYNIEAATASGKNSLLTFGGPWSNHLAATAAAAMESGLSSIGIVRGEEFSQKPTPTLERCAATGMQLIFVSRSAYRSIQEENTTHHFKEQFPDAWVVPEGGANEWGRCGAGEIAQLVPANYPHVCLSVGTGTTFCGIRNALSPTQFVHGFVPMKGGAYLRTAVSSCTDGVDPSTWDLTDRFHFGGFGRTTLQLITFMNEIYERYRLPLDIIYTAKMLAGIKQLAAEGSFDQTPRVLCIHTGGLQGNASVADQLCF
ncbi:MAG: pyridoxal-phosphate dependent enzyme [Sphingobacteriales bacterium]|nr:MAG: pyridoxal-phosphate dependent enzyme [Sphingobacteriales bacterium]